MANQQAGQANSQEVANLAAINWYRDRIGSVAMQIWASNPNGTDMFKILADCVEKLEMSLGAKRVAVMGGDSGQCVDDWTECNGRCIPPGMPCIE